MAKGRAAKLWLISSLVFLLGGALPLATTAAPSQPPSSPNAIDSSAAPSGSAATYRVYAHREGLVGGTTANGHVIQENDHFVALPCACALSKKDGHEFQVKIEYQGKTVIAPVWDVGPWNVDDNYWDPPEQRTYKGIPQGVPEAAAAYVDGYNNGRDGSGRTVRSGAGIDIGDGTFWDLGMTDSDWVNVTFLWLAPAAAQVVTPPKPLPPLPAGYESVKTVTFGDRPPLDRAEPSADPTSTYFDQTGHNVLKPIMDYWNANQGWHNIGLPLTEVFREVKADGTVRLVQYFERQVLQLNPPPSDRPIVESDLIGYSASAPPSSRAPIAPFSDSQSHRYFSATQHSLNNGFKVEWEQYGGLQAFGYPITEEYSGTTADGRPYVAQVFERARFEYWPDKAGTPAAITHSLLVVDLLRQAGWVE